MRLTASILTAAIATAASIAPSYASCKDEVLAALEKQRKVQAFRMKASMISEQGPVNMTVEYAQPDRMRQIVTRAIEPDKSTETILVGGKAWGRDGATWIELSSDVTRDIIAQRDDVLGDEPGTIGTVACLGSTAIDGREVIAYRIENDAQTGPKDMSPDAKEKARKSLADEARPLRMFYVEPQSGLPVRSVFALANKLDKPILKAEYAYDPSIKIDAPN